MKHIVVVGASLAGIHAAEGLRDHGFAGEITLVDADPHLPYDRPPLSKEALIHGVDPRALRLRSASWAEESGVSLRLGRRAHRLDPSRRRIVLDGGEPLGYDGLVIATGSAARPLPTPIRRADPTVPVHLLRTLDDATRLRESLIDAEHVVVLGAGFIGLETASVAMRLGARSTVLEIAPAPLARVLGPRVGAWFRSLHEAHGVEIRCGAQVTGITRDAEASVIRLSSGEEVRAGVVIAGVGAAPATQWLEGSGLTIDDGIVCRADLSTGLPDVVAAGDLARWPNAQYGETMRVEHWTNAVEQGRHAAGTLLGEAAPFVSVPYFWTDQHNAKARFVGCAHLDDDVHIEQSSDDALVALYGRHGTLRGALCVNRPRRLAHYRRLILDRAPWSPADYNADALRP